MSEEIDTRFGKLSKKEDLIWGIVIFVGAIGYALARLFFPESEKAINRVFLLGIGVSFGIFNFIHSFLHSSQQEKNSQDEFEDIVEDYMHDIDAEKKNYKGLWSAVEEWKGKIRERADELKTRLKKDGETEEILDACDTLIEDIENGLDVIQDGNNPLTIKEGKGREPEPLSPLGKIVVPLLIILPGIFLYLVLSGVSWGILALTFVFGLFLFPNWISRYTQEGIQKFKFKHLLGIIIMSGIGYILNQWTYAQSGEVQIAVTIALPILYGLIYYKLKHKKRVREI